MSNRSEACQRILHEIDSRLCSGDRREHEWWVLVRTMRATGMKVTPVNELYAIREFVHDDGCFALPVDERTEIEDRFRTCLEAAKKDFPFFHVEVINVPAGVADFRFAARTGERLPDLNQNQRSIAKVFGIPEEKYQLEIQAKLYGEERYRLFAERFWAFVMEAGKAYSLDSVNVVYDVAAGKFYCELKSVGSTRRAAFAAEVISLPIERGDREGILRAKDAVKVWLEEVLGSLTPAHI